MKNKFMINTELQNEIKKVLENDGVIAYVTDTVWGLGCLPSSEKAVKKICAVNILTIKQMCSIFKKKNEVSHGQKGSHR